MANPEPPIRYTRTPDTRAPGARPDLALPAALVVVDGATLDPGARALAARLGGLEPARVDLLADAGLPIPLGTFEAEAEARALSTRLGRELPGVRLVDPNALVSPLAMGAPALGMAAAVVLAIFLPLSAPSTWLAVLAPWVIGLAVMARDLFRASQTKEALREALRLAAGPDEPADATTALRQRIRALRARLTELPAIAAKDLEQSLTAVETELRGAEGDRLERLEAAISATEAALSGESGAGDEDAAERLERQARALRASAAELSGRSRG